MWEQVSGQQVPGNAAEDRSGLDGGVASPRRGEASDEGMTSLELK